MVMPVRFGTDGIRGRAYEEITVDLAYRTGRAVAGVFSAPVFVGYDTRESSPQPAGVVVSASHNPYYDNGLKVLGLGGAKLDHAIEEAVALALNDAAPAQRASFDEPAIDQSAEHDYAAHLRSLVPSDLSSLHLVIDCANGAASHVAYELFAATGAQLDMLHNAPNGRNINERCGSTHPQELGAH